MKKSLFIIAVILGSITACFASPKTATITDWTGIYLQNHTSHHSNVCVQGYFVIRCSSNGPYYAFDSRIDPFTAEMLLYAKDKGKTVDISYDDARGLGCNMSNYWLVLSVIVR